MAFVAKVKRRLTLPVLKLEIDETQHVKITGAMHLGREEKESTRANANPERAKRQPATLCNCVNLEDGSECQLIVAAVVKSVLTEEYPNDGYVGKCFAITKKPQTRGKDYFPYDVTEIEDPGVPAEMAAAKHAGAAKR